MANTVSLSEAKASLSRLVEEAARGEKIVIAKAGRPRARLVPMCRRAKLRKPGVWKGRVLVADDFDTPLPEGLLAALESAGWVSQLPDTVESEIMPFG